MWKRIKCKIQKKYIKWWESIRLYKSETYMAILVVQKQKVPANYLLALWLYLFHVHGGIWIMWRGIVIKKSLFGGSDFHILW